MIGIIPADRQVVAGAQPAPLGIHGMGHVFPRYPAGPVIRAVFDHMGNKTLTLGPDGMDILGATSVDNQKS